MRCGWAPTGAPTFWNRRVGLGQVDDTGDGDGRPAQAGAADGDGVARGGVQVRGGLLRQQDPGVGAGQGADSAGNRAA